MDIQAPVVDLTPITAPIIEIASALIAGILVAVAKKIWDWIGLKNQEKYQATILKAAETAAALAVQKPVDQTLPRTMQGGRVQVEIKNEQIATAAQYMLTTVPGTLKKLKIIDNDGHASEKLKKLVEGQIAKYVQKLPVVSVEPKA